MKLNVLNFIDFYKADHRRQYPEGTELVYSNFTPRSDRLYGGTKFFDGKVVNVGVEGMCKWLLQEAFNEGFFCIPKEEAVQAYKRRMDNALGPDAIPVDHIEALHDLGYLPLQVKTLPEGAKSPMKVPVMTVCNTIPEFYWLVNYLETVMSNSLWKLMTTATIASEYRAILEHYYEKTGAPKELIEIACHDFSTRGMCGAIDASVSGMGHLLSFSGTDTVSAIDYAENYYGANSDEELVGCSVPATEHSVICMGTKEGELETFRRLITDLYPSGIVSIVSDTWDFWKVITEYTMELKEEILNRQPNALGLCKTVFRPDSGDPVKILTGYRVFRDHFDNLEGGHDFKEGGYDAVEINGQVFPATDYRHGVYHGVRTINKSPLAPHEVKGAVECLWDIFGGTETDKGYKMLNGKVGLIYGDSITRERAIAILDRLEKKGFAASNVVFGVGSYTYQYMTRDTLGFAMKATYGEVNGEPREIFKDPVTDSGTKKSAKGLMMVQRDDQGEYFMVDSVDPISETMGELETVFLNGEVVRETPFSEIRKRVRGEI